MPSAQIIPIRVLHVDDGEDLAATPIGYFALAWPGGARRRQILPGSELTPRTVPGGPAWSR